MFSADPQSQMGQNIYNLVRDGLTYLDTRTEFWRQQKPMYARKRDRITQRKTGSKDNKASANQYIIKELERIDEGRCLICVYVKSASL